MSFQYVRASGAAAAAHFKAEQKGALFIAGGSCVVDLLSQSVFHPALLIDLTGLPNRGVDVRQDGGLRVGALTTMAQLAWHPAVMSHYPVLMQALLSGATPQVHHAATVGGNLLQKTRCPYYRNPGNACNKRVAGSGCAAREGFNAAHALFGASEHCVAVHPSDLAVGLVALDAQVTLEGTGGERIVALADFHTLPGDTPQVESVLGADELITWIDIPPIGAHARSAYSKVDEHNSYSFAVVSVAAVVEVDAGQITRVRLAAGGVAHKPWRLSGSEAALLHQPFSAASIQAASDAAIAGAVPLTHNAHKVELLKRTVTGVLTQLAGQQ